MFSCANFLRLLDIVATPIVESGSMFTTINDPCAGTGSSCPSRTRTTRQFRRSIALQLLLGVLLLISASSSQAQSVTATVTVGPCPNAVAINPTTDTIYVTSVVNSNCSGNDTVTVINGSTNATHTVSSDGSTTLLNPLAISVNSTTDLVYVTDDGSRDGSITLINGVTNAASEIAPNSQTSVPTGIAVNPVTNTIYVLSLEEGESSANGAVTVINGSTGTIAATIPVGSTPTQIAINTVTDKIYVLNYGAQTVTSIDGATSNYSTISIGSTVTGVTEGLPVSLAINAKTNKIYVGGVYLPANRTTFAYSSQILVIDGATNAVSTVTVSSPSTAAVSPYPAEYLAVDATTNMVYGTTGTDAGEVMAYNAATGATTWIAAGTEPTALAVDEGTDTIYVANQGSNNVTVVNGSTNGTTTVNVGAYPTAVAVNTTTHAAYVTNANSATVSVIGGVSTTADSKLGQLALSGSTDNGSCASGYNTLTATDQLENTSTGTLTNPYATNITLTGGNTLLSDSASVTSVAPGGTVTYTFHIQLASCSTFRLSFDVDSD